MPSKYQPFCIWFTGLSGSGKSTLAKEISKKFNQLNISSYILDGDLMRDGLNNDLGFSISDRQENIRRIGEVAKILLSSGIFPIVASISPLELQRKKVKQLFSINQFFEIYLSASIGICEKRDVKGLYKKARMGEIKDFTGIDSIYEEPKSPCLNLDTGVMSIDQCTESIFKLLTGNLVEEK